MKASLQHRRAVWRRTRSCAADLPPPHVSKIAGIVACAVGLVGIRSRVRATYGLVDGPLVEAEARARPVVQGRRGGISRRRPLGDHPRAALSARDGVDALAGRPRPRRHQPSRVAKQADPRTNSPLRPSNYARDAIPPGSRTPRAVRNASRASSRPPSDRASSPSSCRHRASSPNGLEGVRVSPGGAVRSLSKL